MLRATSVKFGKDEEENSPGGGNMGLGPRAPSLNRSKSLRFQRNFEPKELLGMDPSEMEEVELELPIDTVTPLGDEHNIDHDPRESESRTSLSHARSMNGVSICEQDIGGGDHKVIAFSNVGEMREHLSGDKVFVVPATRDEDGTDVSADELTDNEGGCVFDGDDRELGHGESIEAPTRKTVDSKDAGSVRRCCTGAYTANFQAVSEEQITMEEVELDESDSADDGESGQRKEPSRDTGARTSRGRERVRFAPAAEQEGRSSRPQIRGVLKTGRSVSANPCSRIRVIDTEVGGLDDVDTVEEELMEDVAHAKKTRSVNFFFNPDEPQESGDLDFAREKSFGFAGMERADSQVSRGGRSSGRQSGSRRRARSVAVTSRRTQPTVDL